MPRPLSANANKVTLLFLISSLVFYWYSSVRQQPPIVKVDIIDLSPKRVLVTGGAGFIGFHLAKKLAENKDNEVIVLDNFNDYYDVNLKVDRAYELHHLGIKVLHDDICNDDVLFELFAEHRFTHVAHLAAQAGVRYSLENPLAYIRANIQCQVALLDVLKSYQDVKLVYASSSSVYGKMSEVPFTLRAHTDLPGNLYAASKKTDELLGYHYCHAHNISSVGLRFFTVYGPWGRPDMAVFKFAQSILDGTDISLYEDRSQPLQLGRDFTYVDDIIQGILASLDYQPKECGERFNLGYGNPVSVPEMLEILQKELNVPGKLKKVPLPPTEILRTWADLSTSTRLLGFQPQTPLRIGIKQFVEWYKEYRQLRKERGQNKLTPQTAIWFKELERDRQHRDKEREMNAHKKHNKEILERIHHHQNEYFKWAQENGVETPGLKKNEYSFFQGMDYAGQDIANRSDARNNIDALKKICSEKAACFAFNSDGILKSRAQHKKDWKSIALFSEPHQGLYISDLDACQAGLHDCSRNAKCIPSISTLEFTCSCLPEYVGNGKVCIPRYGEVDSKEIQWQYAADFLSVNNVTKMKMGRQMVFFQGMDSPGGDYMVAEKLRGNSTALMEVCAEDPICIGFNTNGVLKRRIVEKSSWKRWTSTSDHGIYVYDIDHCSLAEDCPLNLLNTQCRRLSSGQYSCVPATTHVI